MCLFERGKRGQRKERGERPSRVRSSVQTHAATRHTHAPRGVLFHRAAQRGLCLLREAVHLRQEDNLERAAHLTARERRVRSHLLDEVLHDEAVVHARVAWRGGGQGVSCAATNTRAKRATLHAPGLTSWGEVDATVVTSIDRPDGAANVRCSSFTFSTPAPKMARRSAMMRVFFPAPEGP